MGRKILFDQYQCLVYDFTLRILNIASGKKDSALPAWLNIFFFISYSKKWNTLRNIWKISVFFQILYCYQHSLSNKEIIFQFLNFFIKSLSVLCTYKN